MHARFQNKIDIESNWSKATFAPLKGELIVYAPDENYSYPRFKVGDGVTSVPNLPFNQAESNTYYYNSLSLAIQDINNSTITNTTQNALTAKVKVFDSECGTKMVMLIDNIVENSTIQINKDIALILNGYTLTMKDGSFIQFNQINLQIIGTAPNSKINTSFSALYSTPYFLIRGEGGSIDLKGGTYENIVSTTGLVALLRLNNAIDYCKIADCNLILHNTSTTTNTVTRAIQSESHNVNITNTNIHSISDSPTTASGAGVECFCLRNGKVMITNSSFVAEGQNKSYAINYVSATGTMDITVEDSYLEAKAAYRAIGLVLNDITNIKNSTIKAKVFGQDQYNIAIGVDNNSKGILNISNTSIFADAPGDSADEEISIGIDNKNIAHVNECNIKATQTGISNNDTLYVNGGTYNGYSHGGIYFAHGAGGLAYVNDAHLSCGEYEGEFTEIFNGDTTAIYSSAYIGGGTEEIHNNISVYLDGCTFNSHGTPSITLRNTSGESNNTLYISNSQVDGAIRVDSASNDTNLRVRVGVGTNITPTSKINNPQYAEFTNEIYRMNPHNAGDFNALKNYVDYNAVPRSEITTMIQSYVNESILGGKW